MFTNTIIRYLKVPLFLKRHCDRTLGALAMALAAVVAAPKRNDFYTTAVLNDAPAPGAALTDPEAGPDEGHSSRSVGIPHTYMTLYREERKRAE